MSVGFAMYSIISSANSDSITSSFPIWIHFLSFSCLIVAAGTSNSMLNKSGEHGHLCLVPDLRGNAFPYDGSCGFIIYGLYHVEVCSLYTHFLKRF